MASLPSDYWGCLTLEDVCYLQKLLPSSENPPSTPTRLLLLALKHHPSCITANRPSEPIKSRLRGDVGPFHFGQRQFNLVGEEVGEISQPVDKERVGTSEKGRDTEAHNVEDVEMEELRNGEDDQRQLNLV